MATSLQNPSERRGRGIDTSRYPALHSHFSQEKIDRLFDDDLSAGRSVTGVLIAVITAGLILAIGSTIAVLAWYV